MPITVELLQHDVLSLLREKTALLDELEQWEAWHRRAPAALQRAEVFGVWFASAPAAHKWYGVSQMELDAVRRHEVKESAR